MSHHLPRGDVLAQFGVEQSQLAVDGGAHLQLLLSLTDEHHVFAHVLQVVLHLVHLDGAVEAVLPEPFADEAVFLLCDLIILFGL